MPRRQILIHSTEDFTGGLNLRADPFQLEKNESPDLMNVDVDPRGGIAMRKTIQQMNTTVLPLSPVHNVFSFSTSTGINQVLAKAGTSVYMSTGGNFGAAVLASRANGMESTVTFKDLLFLQDGTNAPRRWDGTTMTALGQSFNDSITAPTNNNMPIGNHIAAFQGMVFVANIKATNEPGIANGTQLRNRIRWSHPNFPMDFRSTDWIDVDIGREGDEIVALVPFSDRLLIFKRSSVHALFGYSRETFNIQPITHAVGVTGPKAIALTEHAVYFFSWPQGVFSYDGRSISWLFERIYPALLDGNVTANNASKVALGWGNRRVWVSVPWNDTNNNRSFIYDPTLGKYGSWVQYDKGFNAFLDWDAPGITPQFLGAHPTAGWVSKLDQVGSQDNITGTPTDIVSWYTTSWHDLGEHAQLKRWKRPEIVVLSDVSSRIRVETFHDYDPATIHQTSEIETILETPDSQWGTAIWGVDKWGRASLTGHNRVAKAGSQGLARALQLRFTGPTSPSRRWRINDISFKYVPRRVRG